MILLVCGHSFQDMIMCEAFMFEQQQQTFNPEAAAQDSAFIHLHELLWAHRHNLSEFGVPEPTILCRPSDALRDPEQEYAKAEARCLGSNVNQPAAVASIRTSQALRTLMDQKCKQKEVHRSS
ncbi:hypothetical protein RRG08_044990 [Elysia crispata]|uniref:Uncharacterized protein n=1 Tax=Elysia crispata TaxID=231223 RepID=A0AAE1CSL4_9GAST|nr:hypothetical protein RRG08_044990 [Elysia crispata]